MNFNQDRYIAIIRGIITMGIVSLLQAYVIQFAWNTYAGAFFTSIFAQKVTILTLASFLLIFYVFIKERRSIQTNEESFKIIIDNVVISAVFYVAIFAVKNLEKYLPKLPI